MCYMNAKGKMHRDLKPDNILIGPNMDVKISDFGLARETTGIFVTGQMGTPLYAGPEVYLNKYDESYSERCDVWGAGMILYEMLTGKLLFQKVNVRITTFRPSKTSKTNGISTKLDSEEYNMTANCILTGSFSPTSCSPTTPRSVLPSIKCWKN